MSLATYTLKAIKNPAKYAIIFLHGLGGSPQEFLFLQSEISSRYFGDAYSKLEQATFIFPRGEPRRISFANQEMNAWFDLKQLGASAARDPSLEDKKGYMESVDKIMALIELLVEEEKIPAKNIILGGFSQGASITLSTALLLKYKIGGVMVCSGFVRAEDEVSKRLSQLGQAPANSLTPVFQSHGVYDDVINIKEGEYANQFLKKCGFDDIKFEKYGFQHTLPPLQDMYDFMVKVLA